MRSRSVSAGEEDGESVRPERGPARGPGAAEVEAKPRFFSSSLTRRERRVYGAVTLCFLLVFVALIWPVYPLFSRVRPFVLGMPFSLFYIVVVLLLAFLVLLGLFVWEGRRGAGLDEREDPGASGSSTASTTASATPPGE